LRVLRRRRLERERTGALGTPGLAAFKFGLKPARLQQYLNVLDRREQLDHERPAL